MVSLESCLTWMAYIVCLLVSHHMQGSHLVGGDVSYEFVSSDQANNQVTFRIRFNMYRDNLQLGGPFDSDAEFGIYQQQSDGSWDSSIVEELAHRI